MGRVLMMALWVAGFLTGSSATVHAVDPYALGVFADEERDITCLPPDLSTPFDVYFWAYLPANEGLAYVTFRLELPDNLQFVGPPQLHPQARNLIITPFPGGSVEWNIIFHGCPGGGWVPVLRRPAALLDEEPSLIRVRAADSMLRDCDFILNDVQCPGDLRLNDPQCQEVKNETRAWSSLKARFRAP